MYVFVFLDILTSWHRKLSLYLMIQDLSHPYLIIHQVLSVNAEQSTPAFMDLFIQVCPLWKMFSACEKHLFLCSPNKIQVIRNFTFCTCRAATFKLCKEWVYLYNCLFAEHQAASCRFGIRIPFTASSLHCCFCVGFEPYYSLGNFTVNTLHCA